MSALARRLARLLYALAVRMERAAGCSAGPDYLALVHPLPPDTGPGDGWGGCGPTPRHVPPPPDPALLIPAPGRRPALTQTPPTGDRRMVAVWVTTTGGDR